MKKEVSMSNKEIEIGGITKNIDEDRSVDSPTEVNSGRDSQKKTAY